MISNSTLNFNGLDCIALYSRYSNGQLRINIVDARDLSSVTNATISVDVAISTEPIHNHFGAVIINDYNKNKGILGALVKAGITSKAGVELQVPVKAMVCHMLINPEV